MDDKQIEYYPFNAINEFMLPEYRQSIIAAVLRDLEKLPGARRAAVNNLIKRSVQVPGFRNSSQAPLGVKVRGAVSTFEKLDQFTAQILQGWSELHPQLRQEVYDLMVSRGMETLPVDADRSKLPGFMTTWPKGATYEALDEAYKAEHPESMAHEYDVRLMIVWIGNRLPLNDDSEEAAAEEEQA